MKNFGRSREAADAKRRAAARARHFDPEEYQGPDNPTHKKAAANIQAHLDREVSHGAITGGKRGNPYHDRHTGEFTSAKFGHGAPPNAEQKRTPQPRSAFKKTSGSLFR